MTSFIAMYAAGRSGVSRSCRLQPSARSMATAAPPLVVATIAPYTAMLTMMYRRRYRPAVGAATRPRCGRPNMQEEHAGMTSVKIDGTAVAQHPAQLDAAGRAGEKPPSGGQPTVRLGDVGAGGGVGSVVMLRLGGLARWSGRGRRPRGCGR